MNTLVIYDSNFGNTKIIADKVAAGLNTAAVSVDEVNVPMLNDIDLLIVGSPINGWRPTVKIQDFLKQTADCHAHLMAAAFDTRMKVFYSGNAAGKISRSLQRSGATIISEPKAFYVTGKEGPLTKGELENAADWANVLRLKAAEYLRSRL